MTIKEVFLRRFRYKDDQILGNLFVFDNEGEVLFQCRTLELGYFDNNVGSSCISSGTYPLVFEYSPKFGRYLWEVKNVPGRSEIKFHPANYSNQLSGCIALGKRHIDIDGDLVLDVTESVDTINSFHIAMAPESHAYLRIIGKA